VAIIIYVYDTHEFFTLFVSLHFYS